MNSASPLHPSREQILLQVENLNQFFNPREHWTNQSGFHSFSQDHLLFLAAGQTAGVVKLESSPIDYLTFDERGREPWWSLPEQDRHLLSPILQRRGGSDLKDEMWSAYQHFVRLNRRAKLEPFFRSLPFGWLHAKSKTFVSAGNIDPSRMLDFMLGHQVHRVGIAGFRWDESDTHQTFMMSWLDFTPDGFRVLGEQMRRHF